MKNQNDNAALAAPPASQAGAFPPAAGSAPLGYLVKCGGKLFTDSEFTWAIVEAGSGVFIGRKAPCHPDGSMDAAKLLFSDPKWPEFARQHNLPNTQGQTRSAQNTNHE